MVNGKKIPLSGHAAGASKGNKFSLNVTPFLNIDRMQTKHSRDYAT
jgi:hypothetical protein